MNFSEITSPLAGAKSDAVNYDLIANITIGLVNIGMAAAQLVLGYLAYRASR
ncbi:hypothetical protein E8E13_003174, partial [Curvularia kusanoi]